MMKRGFKKNIEVETIKNDDFRHVLYSGEHLQLVLMSLAPSEDIGLEVHTENDQFFRFESGQGTVIINETVYEVMDGDAVIVPAGSQHNVVNTSSNAPLKFYTIYAPAHHKDKIVRKTKAEAQSDAPDFDGVTTEV